MKLTAEDYQRHYQGLGDEELLAIDSGELVEVARRCYEAELARRQFEPPEADEAPEPETTRQETVPVGDLVQVAVLTRYETGTYVQRLLQDADIPAFLERQTGGKESLRLMVPASCVEAARDLLAGPLTESNKMLVRDWFQNEWIPEGMDLQEFSVAIDDLIGEEDKVAVRMTVEGIHPQTGRGVKIAGLAMARVADGKIAETWIKLDD